MGESDVRVTVSFVGAGVYREPVISGFYRTFLACLEAVFRFYFLGACVLLSLLRKKSNRVPKRKEPVMHGIFIDPG